MLLQDNQEDTIRDLIDQVLQICHITVNNLLKAKTTDILSNFFILPPPGAGSSDGGWLEHGGGVRDRYGGVTPGFKDKTEYITICMSGSSFIHIETL